MRTRPTHVPEGQRPATAITIDLEDWHQLVRRRATGRLNATSARVRAQTTLALDLLDRARAKATFFVLGLVAEEHPDLVHEVRARGHEVASHGYAHVPLHRLTRDEVHADVARSLDLLQSITGDKVRGYRAPEFSITRANPEALEVLAELGLEYDSSIFPIVHRRYGIPGFPRAPCVVELPSGREIVEFPLATRKAGRSALPVAGGGYFRLLPAWALRRGVSQAAEDGCLANLYFHPYEFDPETLAIPRDESRAAGARFRAWQRLQNVGRASVPGKLEPILASSTCVPLRDALGWIQPATAPVPVPSRPIP